MTQMLLLVMNVTVQVVLEIVTIDLKESAHFHYKHYLGDISLFDILWMFGT